jgi:hypothetical protein
MLPAPGISRSMTYWGIASDNSIGSGAIPPPRVTRNLLGAIDVRRRLTTGHRRLRLAG